MSESIFRTKEQAQFSSFVKAHLEELDAPLLIEGATGLGKTRAYLAAVFSSGKRVAIALPTHQLIDQLLASKDIAAVRRENPRSIYAFRPQRFFSDENGIVDRIAYEANRELAQEADVLVCTSASVILDQRLGGGYNGSTAREVILFDEADQTPALAALQSDLEITKRELSDLVIKGHTPLQTVDEIVKKKAAAPEVRAKAKVIKEALEGEDVWYRKVGMTSDGGVALYHRLPGRLLKRISNRPSTIFVSATLSIGEKFDDFRRSMGISDISRHSRVIEPKSHGKLIFDFHLKHDVDTQEWLSNVVDQVRQSTDEGPVLCVTGSHKLAHDIGEHIPEATVRNREETTSEAAERMGNSKILIAAGAWAGLDTATVWKTVVVPRIPFLGPKEVTEEWVDGYDYKFLMPEPKTSYFDSRNVAIRRMKQVMGRGLRSPDAVCSIVICDPRVSQLGDIVPQRFREAWHEGRRIEVTMSTSERNPGLRREALRYHGTVCQACGYTPLVLREVEVHHLHPLADRGPGNTTMDDVAVLCRNCHAVAHTNGNNVIPVSQIKAAREQTDIKKARRIIDMG